MDTRKRGRPEASLNVNGGFKKSKPEMESLSGGIGIKSKPCMKYFSMSGCPFGENCHFLHYVPGGYNAVAKMMNLGTAPVPRNIAAPPPPIPNGASSPGVKSRICNKYNTAEGCKFGDKCHFAHGEWELGKPIPPSHDDPRAMGSIPGRFATRLDPLPSGPAPSFGSSGASNFGTSGASNFGASGPPSFGSLAAASFGASATAKISIDASLGGAIIGKGGVNSKQICRQTGAKLSIREHESDTNLRNIELEGTFEQIKLASTMVRELIEQVGSVPPPKVPGVHPAPKVGNLKTKLCENFAKGSCSFGERCHFAHGEAELRKPAA